MFAAEFAVELGKGNEHFRKIARRDADPRILHRDDKAVRVEGGFYLHAASRRRELDRIGEEVEKDLLKLQFVDAQSWLWIRQVALDDDPLLLGEALNHRQAGG